MNRQSSRFRRLPPPDAGFSVSDNARSVQADPKTIDDMYAEVAQRNPAFAGFVQTEDGRGALLVTNRNERAAVATEFRRVFGSGLSLPADHDVREVSVGFRQLYQWRGRLNALFSRVPAVASLDIDEENNRLTVGILDEAARQEVESQIQQLGVPLGAVHIKQTPPAVPLVTLADAVRPTYGGLKLWAPPGPTGFCTMGFNTIYNGRSSFASNGHCSVTPNAVDPSAFLT